jgi:hypothetical protein
MRNAADQLRRGDAAEATERAGRALEQLRRVEHDIQAATPDEQRRALGETQLEARQLADAQRQVGAELAAAPAGEAGRDTRRRLAGEQDRLADRAGRLRDELQRQGAGTSTATPNADAARDMRDAAGQASREIDRQRLVERMEQSADQMRAAAEGTPSGPEAQRAGQAMAAAARDQQEVAQSLERLADQLSAASASNDAESRKLTDQMALAQQLRDQIDRSMRELERLDQEATKAGDASTDDPAAPTGDADRLRADLKRQLQETQKLLEQLRREDSGSSQQGGAEGFTFEGQDMVLSAPGTEGFKQDFEKWDELRAQATQALERAGLSLAGRLNAREARDRLASGIDDRVPAEYQQHVDSYFKAIANKKAP